MGILDKALKINIKELESVGVITKIKEQLSGFDRKKKQI